MDFLNEWLAEAYCAFVRSDISRVEHHVVELSSVQGTLQCCGRTEKLCVGGILRGGTRMPR